ncbi:hypothetical protein M3Y97_01022600 [Aphelenchoides bicaudatus]|nr:hypothetical protein M3Y97_01022600 [Aphelenchoides bicaudatus]
MDQQEYSPFCAAGCGFFGSASTNGFCSKCFKDTINKTQDNVGGAASTSGAPASADLNRTCLELPNALKEAAGEAGESSTPQVKEKSSTRCHVCRRKTGLLGFTCRCGGLFCGEHRYHNEHG